VLGDFWPAVAPVSFNAKKLPFLLTPLSSYAQYFGQTNVVCQLLLQDSSITLSHARNYSNDRKTLVLAVTSGLVHFISPPAGLVSCFSIARTCQTPDMHRHYLLSALDQGTCHG
jgi:hypothetical protein